MKNHPMLGFFHFEWLMFRRNFVTVFFLLFFPPMMLLLFGSIYGNEPNPLFGGLGTVDVTLPAYSGIVIAVTGIMNFPLSLCEYREKGIFKRYRATPAKPYYVIYSQLIINALMTLLGMALLVAVGRLAYRVRLTSHWAPCLLILLLSILSIYSIGFFIGGIAPNVKAATSISFLLFFPMLFFSGASFPYELLPPAVQKAAQFLPLSYTVSAMKSVWHGGTLRENGTALLVLCGFALGFALLSKITFRWEK